MKALVGTLLLFFGTLEVAAAQDIPSAAQPQPAWTVPSNQEIRELLTERMQHNGVGIVVGIVEPSGRRVITHGKSGAPDHAPLTADSLFQIGSVTKVLTTLLLADMVQRGEVKLDDPASKYLPPGMKMPQLSRPITLHDLATHRSGLPAMPTNFDLAAKPDPYEAYSVAQLQQFLANHTLRREPGEKEEYSNFAVALLGRLLAQRARLDYETLLKQRVLKPLGMNDTTLSLTPEQSKRLAQGHDRYLQPVRTWYLKTLPASGSLFSSANDMMALLSAHLGYDNTPLRAAMENQRTTRHPAQASQALGLGVRSPGSNETFGHEGGKEGYRAAIVFNPQSRTGIVVLANAYTDDKPSAIALYLLLGRPLSPAPAAPARPQTVELRRDTLNRYAGLYQLGPDRLIEVAVRDDHLLVDFRGNGIDTFFPSAPGEFFLNTGEGQISFAADSTGRISTLIHRAKGKEQTARRL